MGRGEGLEGLSDVLRRLNREIDLIRNRGVQGLIRAAILIRRDMEQTPPLIPLDTGNLRDSWFVVPYTSLDRRNAGIVIGFNASYAVFVHENMGSTNWKRPNSGPKFLEAALKRNVDPILKLVGITVRIR